MRRRTAAICAVLALGYGAMLWGILSDGRIDAADLRSLGGCMTISCLTWAMVTRSRCDENAIFTAGTKIGFDKGWRACKSTMRPVVVDLAKERAARRESEPA